MPLEKRRVSKFRLSSIVLLGLFVFENDTWISLVVVTQYFMICLLICFKFFLVGPSELPILKMLYEAILFYSCSNEGSDVIDIFVVYVNWLILSVLAMSEVIRALNLMCVDDKHFDFDFLVLHVVFVGPIVDLAVVVAKRMIMFF